MMEKQTSFKMKTMEKQSSFRHGVDKQVSFHDGEEKQESTDVMAENNGGLLGGIMEKQKSFRGLMEKQKSFRIAMERQFSFGGVSEKKKSNESPGKRGDSLLHLAARAGNLSKAGDIIQSVQDGSDSKELLCGQNHDGETPLYVAAENGHDLVVAELLKHIDLRAASMAAKNGLDPLHIAARQGHVEVLKQLLEVFPNLAMTADPSNATALHTSATKGHMDVFSLLLKTDSNLAKIARNNGKTVLHSSARLGHVEAVKALLQNDPSMCFRADKKGQTALHMAVKGQNLEVVLELLKPDPSVVNVEDSRGNTAVHTAARKGRTQNLSCLLSVDGVNINALNNAGESPLDIAEKFGTPEMVSILKEAGALSSKDLGKPQSAAKQLKQTVSDIKHDVESQVQQNHQTGVGVKRIAKRLKKLQSNGLNNAINSATVVAVLIATVAFAAIYQVPGQYVDSPQPGATLGQAEIADSRAFMVFFMFDSVALFISLAVVVVQTSVVVVEQKAKQQLMFVINKLMWLACLCISVAFISLTYVVVGPQGKWIAIWSTVIGGVIMLTTIGSMCYCVILSRLGGSKLKKRRSLSNSVSMSVTVLSDPDILSNEYKGVYVL
ncbi:Ankyrin repeat-containing protein [Drosera capensis]